MKVIENTLEIEIERWEDPGGSEPNGAGSPVPSHNFVAGYGGVVVVELDGEERKSLADYADVDMTEMRMYEAYFADNAAEVEHGQAGLTVKKWCVEKIAGNGITLSVEEFEADEADAPEPEYDPMDKIDRREEEW